MATKTATKIQTKTTELGEKSDEAKVRKMHEAKMLMENPMFSEAMEAIYSFWDTYWKKTSPGEDGVKDREMAHAQLLAHGAFQHVLTKSIEDGTVSEATIEEVKKRTRMDSGSSIS